MTAKASVDVEVLLRWTYSDQMVEVLDRRYATHCAKPRAAIRRRRRLTTRFHGGAVGPMTRTISRAYAVRATAGRPRLRIDGGKGGRRFLAARVRGPVGSFLCVSAKIR